jgi:hypothetical protein
MQIVVILKDLSDRSAFKKYLTENHLTYTVLLEDDQVPKDKDSTAGKMAKYFYVDVNDNKVEEMRLKFTSLSMVEGAYVQPQTDVPSM